MEAAGFSGGADSPARAGEGRGVVVEKGTDPVPCSTLPVSIETGKAGGITAPGGVFSAAGAAEERSVGLASATSGEEGFAAGASSLAVEGGTT